MRPSSSFHFPTVVLAAVLICGIGSGPALAASSYGKSNGYSSSSSKNRGGSEGGSRQPYSSSSGNGYSGYAQDDQRPNQEGELGPAEKIAQIFRLRISVHYYGVRVKCSKGWLDPRLFTIAIQIGLICF